MRRSSLIEYSPEFVWEKRRQYEGVRPFSSSRPRSRSASGGSNQQGHIYSDAPVGSWSPGPLSGAEEDDGWNIAWKSSTEAAMPYRPISIPSASPSAAEGTNGDQVDRAEASVAEPPSVHMLAHFAVDRTGSPVSHAEKSLLSRPAAPARRFTENDIYSSNATQHNHIGHRSSYLEEQRRAYRLFVGRRASSQIPQKYIINAHQPHDHPHSQSRPRSGSVDSSSRRRNSCTAAHSDHMHYYAAYFQPIKVGYARPVTPPHPKNDDASVCSRTSHQRRRRSGKQRPNSSSSSKRKKVANSGEATKGIQSKAKMKSEKSSRATFTPAAPWVDITRKDYSQYTYAIQNDRYKENLRKQSSRGHQYNASPIAPEKGPIPHRIITVPLDDAPVRNPTDGAPVACDGGNSSYLHIVETTGAPHQQPKPPTLCSRPSSAPRRPTIAAANGIPQRHTKLPNQTANDNDNTIEASKPLVWSKQFGQRGRFVRQEKERKAKTEAAKRSEPPKRLPENLVDIVQSMVKTLCTNFQRKLISIREMCEQHFVCGMETKHGEHSTSGANGAERNMSSLDYALADAAGGRKCGSSNESDIIERSSLSENISSSQRAKGYNGVEPEDTAVGKIVRLIELADQEGFDPFSDQIKLHADAVDTASGGPKTTDQIRREMQLKLYREIFSSLTDQERVFLDSVGLLKCTPNHRPSDEIATMLVWILGSTATQLHHDQHQSVEGGGVQSASVLDNEKLLQKLFAKFDEQIQYGRKLLVLSSSMQSDRGPNKEKEEKIVFRQLTKDLQNYYQSGKHQLIYNAQLAGEDCAGGSKTSHASNNGSRTGTSRIMGAFPFTPNASHQPQPPCEDKSTMSSPRLRMTSCASRSTAATRKIMGTSTSDASSGHVPQYTIDGTPRSPSVLIQRPSLSAVQKPHEIMTSSHRPQPVSDPQISLESSIRPLGREYAAQESQRQAVTAALAGDTRPMDAIKASVSTAAAAAISAVVTAAVEAARHKRTLHIATETHFGFVAYNDIKLLHDADEHNEVIVGRLMARLAQFRRSKAIVIDSFKVPEQFFVESDSRVVGGGSGALSKDMPSAGEDMHHDHRDHEASNNEELNSDSIMRGTALESCSVTSMSLRAEVASLSPLGSAVGRSNSNNLSNSRHSLSDGGGFVVTKQLHIEDDPNHSEQMLRQLAFFHYAPRICERQRGMLELSLFSDMARTVILIVGVLVKHAAAGRLIERDDVELMMGKPLVEALGGTNSSCMKSLILWLRANRKVQSGFRLTSLAHAELVLQRLYSFWPELGVVVDTKDSNIRPRCQMALSWPHRNVVNSIFREPDAMEPNLNML